MKKLYLVRHGQSVANVDEDLYYHIPDYQMPLTEKGRLQAEEAGNCLAHLLSLEDSPMSIGVIHSPWLRAKHTAEIIQSCVEGSKLTEDPLIYEHSVTHSYKEMEHREDYESKEKHHYGAYWYKTGTSESLADVYQRARLFVNDLRNNRYKEDTLVIVSHGIFIKMVKGVLNNLSVNDIMDMALPYNCQILIEDI